MQVLDALSPVFLVFQVVVPAVPVRPPSVHVSWRSHVQPYQDLEEVAPQDQHQPEEVNAIAPDSSETVRCQLLTWAVLLFDLSFSFSVTEPHSCNHPRYAVCSALAASALPSLVMARGHKIDQVPECPLVVEDSVEGVDKTLKAVKVLTELGAFEDVEKSKASRQVFLSIIS